MDQPADAKSACVARSADIESDRPFDRRLLSIVLPAYNEQEVLPMTYERFTAVGPALAEMGFDYELIFVNDGSRDATANLLDELAERDSHVRAVHLTRNFGHQAAISAGLTLARGQVIAVMDCDLQDPPEVLPRFLAKWREGYQVIFAVRRKRKEWLGKRLAYWTFYRLMAVTAEMEIPLDSGDFCVMDRQAVDLLNRLPERQRFVRGLRTWVGLKQTGLEYERDARAAGVPQYTFRKLLALAADGLVSFSGVPLRMVTRMGMLCACLSLVFLLWIVADALFDVTNAPPGWASLACLITFVGAVQLISLGIIGEYLSRIFIEVKGRPTFLVARVVEQAPLAGADHVPDDIAQARTGRDHLTTRKTADGGLAASAADRLQRSRRLASLDYAAPTTSTTSTTSAASAVSRRDPI